MSNNAVFLSGKFLSLAALSCFIALAAIFYLSDDDSPKTEAKTNFAALQSSSVKNEMEEDRALTGPTTLPGIKKNQNGFDFDDEMKLKLKDISDAYAEQAKYPSYSVPIHADELSTKYLPDMPVAAELPADLSDPNSPSLSILPSKFRYLNGEDLSAIAQISGLADEETSYVSARLIMQDKTLGVAVVSPVADQSHHYQLNFDAFGIGKIEWKENITIEVEFQLLGNIYTRNITVEYLNTIAQIEDVGASEVQDEYLIIPVYVATDKPGFHRLEANLYDTETNQPLIHLTAEDQLLSSNGQLTLKAHISALKVSGSEGPYTLKDLMLRRLPAEPDYITEFGQIEQAYFEVDGYLFSEFQDKPYINEKAQRIANELRNLGS